MPGLLMLLSSTLWAQNDTDSLVRPLTISGYLEVYDLQDFNQPPDHTLPAFFYNYTRTQEIGLNLAYIKASYINSRVRAHLALGAGSYMNANYAAEPGLLKSVYEANLGVKISRTRDLWIDAGVLPSHIGFESAVGKDNWTLTRSLAAENSPYFETGLRLSYTTPNARWYLAGLYLNGWQRIERVDGNQTPAFGMQITFKPSPRVTLNYSNFGGSDLPDSVRRMRWFNDLYGIFQWNRHWAMTVGWDYGLQQSRRGSARDDPWSAAVVIVRYAPSERISVAARGEYYRDTKDVLIAAPVPGGFRASAFSANVDYHIGDHVLTRLEARNFFARDRLFVKQADTPSDRLVWVAAALSICF